MFINVDQFEAIKKFVRNESINYADGGGWTALHEATRIGKFKIVSLYC